MYNVSIIFSVKTLIQTRRDRFILGSSIKSKLFELFCLPIIVILIYLSIHYFQTTPRLHEEQYLS